MYSQKVDLFLNIFLQNILGLQMKSRIVIFRYNLVMYSFFARNNYSALSPPSPGAQKDRKFGKCNAKKKAANSLCKALFGQETSPTPCTLLTTCPSLDPRHRQAQDREQDRTTAKERTLLRGNQERLKLELQSQQAYSMQELKAWLPK